MTQVRGRRLLLGAVLASHFGPPFMFSGVGVALPAMGARLDAGATALGLVETLFLVGSMTMLLPAGRLADAVGRAALFRAGMLAFALLSLAIGGCSSIPWILALRCLQGAASALFAAAGTALLVELAPVGRLGAVLGASMGIVYAGLFLGPLVAGWLVDHWGWRAVFTVGGAVIFAGWLPVAAYLPVEWRRPGAAVHWPSAVLILAATAAAVAATALMQCGWCGPVGLAAALALTAWFAVVQLRVPRPLLDLQALRTNAPLRGALGSQLLLYLNAFCSMFLLNLHLQITVGLTAVAAGRVLAAGSLTMAIVAPLSGRLADRTSPRRVAAAGIVAVIVSALVARSLGPSSGSGTVLTVLCLQGLGFGLFSSPNMMAIMGAMRPDQRGVASALAAMARSVGMVTGMLTAASLIALQFGGLAFAAAPERLGSAVTAVYTVLSVTSAAALVVALRGTG